MSIAEIKPFIYLDCAIRVLLLIMDWFYLLRMSFLLKTEKLILSSDYPLVG